MDAATTALAEAIGGKVRHERRSRRWTLDQLADAAGVSRRMVVNVEQGTANPSVGMLLRISDALGIGLPGLVEQPETAQVNITRRDTGAALWTGVAGGRGVLVAGTTPPDVVELWDWTLGVGDRHASEAHAQGTRELLHVLSGKVSLEVAGEQTTLSVGDAASFPGDLPHAYGNVGRGLARFSLSVFEPAVGPARSREGR